MVSVHNAKFRDSIFKCKSTSHNNKNNNNCLHTGLAHIKKILHEIPINERNFYLSKRGDRETYQYLESVNLLYWYIDRIH